MEKQIIEAVYKKLKDREINPSGSFDSAGRFYATTDDVLNSV